MLIQKIKYINFILREKRNRIIVGEKCRKWIEKIFSKGVVDICKSLAFKCLLT